MSFDDIIGRIGTFLEQIGSRVGSLADEKVEEAIDAIKNAADGITGENAKRDPKVKEELIESERRVVRLDVAVYALHLASARIAARNMPELYRQKINDTKRSIAESAGTFVAGKVLSRVASTLLGVMRNIADIWIAARQQEELANNIATVIARTKRELNESYLSQVKHKKRLRKLVSSRHKTPNQRKANGLG